MKNILLASTSSLFGEEYLAYLKPEIELLFQQADEIIFIPYARPGGLTHDEYTAKAVSFFETIRKAATAPVFFYQGRKQQSWNPDLQWIICNN